jgi:hypothetical protein
MLRVRRVSLERAGTWNFLVIVLAIGLAVAASLLMNSAADDLRAQMNIASHQAPDSPRTPWGVWLASRLETDVASIDTQTLKVRADDLDHRADRIRELAGAASLAGLILMVATATPEARLAGSSSEINPVASTRSNGTV